MCIRDRYVVATDWDSNTLVIGPHESLGDHALRAARVNWVSGSPPLGTIRANVQIRYLADAVPAMVTPVGDDRADVKFQTRLRDITPGQAAVFYDGDLCLGGGVIEK